MIREVDRLSGTRSAGAVSCPYPECLGSDVRHAFQRKSVPGYPDVALAGWRDHVLAEQRVRLCILVQEATIAETGAPATRDSDRASTASEPGWDAHASSSGVPGRQRYAARWISRPGRSRQRDLRSRTRPEDPRRALICFVGSGNWGELDLCERDSTQARSARFLAWCSLWIGSKSGVWKERSRRPARERDRSLGEVTPGMRVILR